MTRKLTRADLDALAQRAFGGKTFDQVRSEQKQSTTFNACYGNDSATRLAAVKKVIESKDEDWAKDVLLGCKHNDAAGALLDGFAGKFDTLTLMQAAAGRDATGLEIVKRTNDPVLLERIRTRVWIATMEPKNPVYGAAGKKIAEFETIQQAREIFDSDRAQAIDLICKCEIPSVAAIILGEVFSRLEERELFRLISHGTDAVGVEVVRRCDNLEILRDIVAIGRANDSNAAAATAEAKIAALTSVPGERPAQ
jgi:hypothetical protein